MTKSSRNTPTELSTPNGAASWRQHAIRGMKVGDVFIFSRTFDREETVRFGDLARDYNPVHYEERFSDAKGFDGLICHGLLVGSMICQIGGQVGWLATGMDFRFLKPVYFGDTITCTLTITELDEHGRAHAHAHLRNQGMETVIEAQLSGRIPSHQERMVLEGMIASGDPSNGIRDPIA